MSQVKIQKVYLDMFKEIPTDDSTSTSSASEAQSNSTLESAKSNESSSGNIKTCSIDNTCANISSTIDSESETVENARNATTRSTGLKHAIDRRNRNKRRRLRLRKKKQLRKKKLVASFFLRSASFVV